MAGDASAMPTSISISTLATLKTWIDIVQQSREAGISVTTKGSQLWHVGAGLPLDALKKGSIVDWACSYTLEKAEVPPLLDALIKNTSLGRLNLAESGLTWDASGSASPLVDAMKSSSSALSGLEVLVLSKESGCELPIAELRAGPERAFAALENLNFYTPRGGAWFTDIMVCGDLLRTSPNQRSLTRLEREMEVEREMERERDAGQFADGLSDNECTQPGRVGQIGEQPYGRVIGGVFVAANDGECNEDDN